ncbi:MAG: GLPGLI family protein [Flavobacteriaceae bacterium]|nr:GLPGLI family protein [Flavobacteriaceae bacterium]
MSSLKYFIVVFLIISYTNVSSQDNKWVKIEYTQAMGRHITNASLFFDNNESIYLFGNHTKIDTTSYTNLIYNITDDIGSVIYKNHSENKLLTREASATEVKLINDDFPNLNWTITEETKKINELSLTKAHTNFRGRNYIAWYCDQIPVNNGPLKMGGLPGIILELKTTDGFLNVSFDKINYQHTKPVVIHRILNKYDRIITQKQSVEENKQFVENLKAKLKAKLPRDVEIKINVDEFLEKEFKLENEKQN